MNWSNFPSEKVQAAREEVANWWAENARLTRQSNLYAAHVTESKKDEILEKGLRTAEEIHQGLHDSSFLAWQRINTELTGECVPLLPKKEI